MHCRERGNLLASVLTLQTALLEFESGELRKHNEYLMERQQKANRPPPPPPPPRGSVRWPRVKARLRSRRLVCAFRSI